MGTIAVNRLAGLSLIIGPTIAFVFFLLEPGGLLIDSATASDAVGAITAKSANAALTNVTNIAIILGLSLILSGLYALMRNVTLQGNGKAFVQMGFFVIFVGLTGWILSGGMDFILADAQISDEARDSVPVFYVGSVLLYAGGLAVGFGGFIFALGLSTRDDFNRIISLLAALVSLAVMVFFITAMRVGISPCHLSLLRKSSMLDGDGGPTEPGMELTICKGNVGAHGGRERRAGPGGRFTFTLPAEAVQPSPGRGRSGRNRVRILAVDDGPQTLRYVRDALSALHCANSPKVNALWMFTKKKFEWDKLNIYGPTTLSKLKAHWGIPQK